MEAYAIMMWGIIAVESVLASVSQDFADWTCKPFALVICALAFLTPIFVGLVSKIMATRRVKNGR